MNNVLSQWEAWQEAQGLSRRTMTERSRTMSELFELTGADPLTLTPAAIIAFCGRRELSPASKATYHATIRAYCAWMIAAELRDDDPSKKTPRPKRPKPRPRPVLSSQLGRVLAAVNRRRTRMMVLLAAAAGLRVHEVAKVHGDDVELFWDDEAGRMAGNITVLGKGGQVAVIPLHESIVDLAPEFPRHGYWFPAYASQSDAEHITANAVSAAISRVMDKAGVNATPHQLRHWYGSELVKEGVHMRIVQGLMRHESVQSTQIYTYTDLTMFRQGLNRVRLPEARAA